VNTSTLLRQLTRIKDHYTTAATERKLALLRAVDRRRLSTAKEVYRLHEVLGFLHAYPDDRRVRWHVEQMLKRFSQRSDLRRFANELADTGIEGTAINYAFYWPTALWFETKWPGHLSIDWASFDEKDKVWGALYPLLPFTESMVIDESEVSNEELLERLKKADETDAGFLIRRILRSYGNDNARQTVYEDLDIPCTLSPGQGTPTRTGACYKPSPVVFQSAPLDRSRPDLKTAIMQPPEAVRSLSPREGRKLIDMARTAMVTRGRDLYVFQQGEENDVRMIDYGDGLQFAAIGLRPEYRLVLDTIYAFLTLKNGVPIGYVLTRSYFNSSEVAYNVFETFRGGESAQIYGRVLAMTRHLFGTNAFTVDPYQLGHNNEEGLKSGAWWFYYKLGFRPLDPGVKRLLRLELARMRRNPGQRSRRDTLNKLSSRNMFFYLRRPRKDIRGIIPVGNIALAISSYLGRRFGSDREKAIQVCEKEAARLLGIRSFRGFTAAERQAWRRWGPVILALPGVERWSRAEKRALAEVARAKGGRRESDYVGVFDAHRKLRRALLKLAERGA
jgi:hypothetical protein